MGVVGDFHCCRKDQEEVFKHLRPKMILHFEFITGGCFRQSGLVIVNISQNAKLTGFHWSVRGPDELAALALEQLDIIPFKHLLLVKFVVQFQVLIVWRECSDILFFGPGVCSHVEYVE